MNPKTHGIWYYDEVKIPIVDGFLHKKVTEDEFEKMEMRLPPSGRIYSKAFAKLGFNGMYVPKDETRIEKAIANYKEHGPLIFSAPWMATDC